MERACCVTGASYTANGLHCPLEIVSVRRTVFCAKLQAGWAPASQGLPTTNKPKSNRVRHGENSLASILYARSRQHCLDPAMGVLTSTSLSAGPLLAALLLLYIAHSARVYAKLRRFKGPRWTGFSDWPHSRALLGPSCHEWYAEVSEKYGANCLPQTVAGAVTGLRSDVSLRRHNRPGGAQDTHHVVARDLGACQQASGVQALGLVLPRGADRVPQGQRLQPDGQQEA